VVGKAIVKADHSVAFKKITAEEFVRRVTEHTVWDVVRRGKTLGFSLDSGDRIDVHLMLKGNMYFAEPKIPEPCVALDFEDGASLVFFDSQYSVSPALHEHRGSGSVLIRKRILGRIHQIPHSRQRF
jgi:formamidopyrimidine-DNA glycosylase